MTREELYALSEGAEAALSEQFREIDRISFLGTKKVMDEHCSIGLVVTTDGTITDIPRSDYLEAEKRAIQDMRSTGKPFLVIINSRHPASQTAKDVKGYLREAFGIDAAIGCQEFLTAVCSPPQTPWAVRSS